MSESLVEAPKAENKMSESFTTIPCLQESVSFGRFEHDSLCWERWSTFPTNKYLEEVEKFSTPGSVAQKKAYFEAHYKRIAARKAELMDQEKKREEEAMNLEDRTLLGMINNTSEDVERLSTQNSVDGTEMLSEGGKLSGEMSYKYIDIPVYNADIVIEEDGVVDLASEVNEHVDELSDGVDEVADLIVEVSENIDGLNVEANVTIEKVHIQLNHMEEQELTDGAELIKENKNIQPQDVDGVGEAREKRDLQPENNDESHCGTDMIKENKDIHPQLADANKDLILKTEIPHLVKPNEPVLIEEDIASARVWQDKEVLPQEKVEERKITKKETKTPLKLVDPMKKKTTQASKMIDTSITKKKPASPIPRKPVASMLKSTMISTPKPSRPELTKTAKSTICSSVKKINGHTPLTSKKATKPERNRVLPTSLNMSLCYGSANSEPDNTDPSSLTTMRKSLIMERMGEKDIVKRAFKAFQNINQLSPSSLQKPTATNKSSTKRFEVNASAPDALQKKKERLSRAGKATSKITGVVQGKASQSPGLKKNIGVDQRNSKAVPPASLGSRNGKYAPASFGSRSLDQGRQQREVPKELEPKTDMKDAGKIHLQSKLKAEKTTDIGKPARCISSIPKLSSSYNQGHGFLRGFVCKVDAKI